MAITVVMKGIDDKHRKIMNLRLEGRLLDQTEKNIANVSRMIAFITGCHSAYKLLMLRVEGPLVRPIKDRKHSGHLISIVCKPPQQRCGRQVRD